MLALELICAAQALDFQGLDEASPPARAVHQLVRSTVPFVEQDRFLHPEIQQLAERILAGEVTAAAEEQLAEPLM